MYDIALDGYAPPMEPPDGYYFMTDAQMAEAAELEAENEKWEDDRPGTKPGHSGYELERRGSPAEP